MADFISDVSVKFEDKTLVMRDLYFLKLEGRCTYENVLVHFYNSKLSCLVTERTAAVIIKNVQTSTQFVVRLLSYVLWKLAYKCKILKKKEGSYCDLQLSFFVNTRSLLSINYAWSERLELLSYRWSLLKDAAAWLSTLGGGHSALGDRFQKHASEAGKISIQQYKLALVLGDDGLLYRCRLYYALSLIQKARLKQAGKLIRSVHHVAKTKLNDEKLVVMCCGVWSRLKYEYHNRNTRTIFSQGAYCAS